MHEKHRVETYCVMNDHNVIKNTHFLLLIFLIITIYIFLTILWCTDCTELVMTSTWEWSFHTCEIFTFKKNSRPQVESDGGTSEKGVHMMHHTSTNDCTLLLLMWRIDSNPETTQEQSNMLYWFRFRLGGGWEETGRRLGGGWEEAGSGVWKHMFLYKNRASRESRFQIKCCLSICVIMMERTNWKVLFGEFLKCPRHDKKGFMPCTFNVIALCNYSSNQHMRHQLKVLARFLYRWVIYLCVHFILHLQSSIDNLEVTSGTIGDNGIIKTISSEGAVTVLLSPHTHTHTHTVCLDAGGRRTKND